MTRLRGIPPSPPYVYALARQMRQALTPTELALWFQLRRRQLGDYRFRRQEPIGRYIVDFVTFDTGVIVEVDGDIHRSTEMYDALRDDWLRSLDFHVLRVQASDVEKDVQSVLFAIQTACESR